MITLVGIVTLTNLTPVAFEQLAHVIEGTSNPSNIEVIGWTLDRGLSPSPGWMSFFLRVPVQKGETLMVNTIVNGGGWGISEENYGLSRGNAATHLRLGNFTATSVIGTLKVVETSPLRLMVHLKLEDANTEIVQIQGEMRFQRLTERIQCD